MNGKMECFRGVRRKKNKWQIDEYGMGHKVNGTVHKMERRAKNKNNNNTTTTTASTCINQQYTTESSYVCKTIKCVCTRVCKCKYNFE